MMEFKLMDKYMCDMPRNLELISEEKLPSFNSSCCMTNSVCSDSTIDLDDFDHNHSIMNDSNADEERKSNPLKNNFLSEKHLDQCHNHSSIEIEISEPSIKPVKQSHSVFGKSVSLHDVSSILPLNLTTKSNTVSSETINSQSLSSTTKSKDSGFQRSLSCLSITSGRKSYEHVQSKVKAYIKNIKESEALNKKNKLLKQQEKSVEPETFVNSSNNIIAKDDLMKEIQELKHELHEKSLYIDAQQRNYNKLLLKFAEARNIINTLRVQSMCYNNYGDEDDSKNPIPSSSKVHFDIFDCKTVRNSMQIDSCNSEKTFETTNEISKANFNPCSHSSPFEKSLSPVRKLFSSSSRLDKNYQPLRKPKQNNSKQPGTPAQNNHRALVQNCVNTSINGSLHLNNHSNVLQCQSSSIDLPNDDPFDKVKKWQASLPSINLLGSFSSSDCEEPEAIDSSCTANNHSRMNESNSWKCGIKSKANESEICNFLSEELQNKCKISEIDVCTESQAMKIINNQSVDKKSKKDQLNTLFAPKKMSDKEVSLNIKNKISNSKKGQELNKMMKSQNCLVRGNSVEIMFPPSEHENRPKPFISSHPLESSLSESLSTYLPKSSSLSYCRINNLENDNSDDSSSISSSVLGSDSIPPFKSHRKTKRRLVLIEDDVANKVPKTTQSRSSQTTFILKEPKLNFSPQFENNHRSPMISKNRAKNYEEARMEKVDSTKELLKTESSQKKAWKARNNANFYVCKDFTFSKCDSLTECIRDMEGLVSKGVFFIRASQILQSTTVELMKE